MGWQPSPSEHLGGALQQQLLSDAVLRGGDKPTAVKMLLMAY